MSTDRLGKVVTLSITLILVSSCNRMDGDDPNLKMTFSCHGNSRTKTYWSGGPPEVTTQPVSHSISFWRIENDDLQKMRSISRYKITKYSIDGRIVNTSPKVKDVTIDVETLGFFRSYEDFPEKKGRNGGSIGHRQTFEFNMITRTLEIQNNIMEWHEKEGRGQQLEQIMDTAKCELVSDKNILKEVSVVI